MPGQKFGNVSGVALTPQGHLLVFNRNPTMMMVEYDAQGKFLRTFNPNIAVNTHGMRVDRYGNIWVLDSFLNVLWKLKPNGEPVMTVGAGMDGMIMSLDENGKITGWLGKGGRDTDGATSNLIGEAHYLVVSPDQRTIYIADSVNAKVLKLERN